MKTNKKIWLILAVLLIFGGVIISGKSSLFKGFLIALPGPPKINITPMVTPVAPVIITPNANTNSANSVETPFIIGKYGDFLGLTTNVYSIPKSSLVVAAPDATITKWKRGGKNELTLRYTSIFKKLGTENGYGMYQILPKTSKLSLLNPNEFEIAGHQGLTNPQSCGGSGSQLPQATGPQLQQNGFSVNRSNPSSAVQTRTGQYSSGVSAGDHFTGSVGGQVNHGGSTYDVTMNTKGGFEIDRRTAGGGSQVEAKGDIHYSSSADTGKLFDLMSEGVQQGTIVVEGQTNGGNSDALHSGTSKLDSGQINELKDNQNEQGNGVDLFEEDAFDFMENAVKCGGGDGGSCSKGSGENGAGASAKSGETAAPSTPPDNGGNVSLGDCGTQIGDSCETSNAPSWLKSQGLVPSGPQGAIHGPQGNIDSMDDPGWAFTDPCSGTFISRTPDVVAKTAAKIQQRCQGDSGQCGSSGGTSGTNSPLNRVFSKKVKVLPPVPVDPYRGGR